MSVCSQSEIYRKRVGSSPTASNFDSNLLRNCRFNQKLSVHAALYSTCHYNKTKLDPIGTRFLVHEKTTNSPTWIPHVTDGWHIIPVLERYESVGCYIPSTHITRIADTVEFIYTVILIPMTSSEDYFCQSITYIISMLADPKPTVPSLSWRDDTQNEV